MRCAIVLPEGRYADELNGYDVEGGPRLEFIEIAKATGADVFSYSSAASKRGWLFRTLFGHFKKVGSALNAAMLASEYDRIYVTGEGVGLPLAIFLKTRRWNGKMVCVFHNMSWPSKKRVVSLLGHEMFSALITVNSVQAKILIDECGMPDDKVASVYNWVDQEFFCPKGELWPPAKPMILSCGAENRDYDTLARAAVQVQANFRVYGHGFLESRVSSRSHAANLEFMSRAPYAELRNAYLSCSLVVVPLNDVDYAAGVTGIVEGMSSGRAVIATRSRGVADYLELFDPETVVPAGDDEALANAIGRLIRDPERLKVLGERNRTFAVENFSVDKYAALIKERMLLR